MPNYKSSHPWNPGYAIPGYIRAEPPGRSGSTVTLQLPRGTIGITPSGWNGGYAVPDYIVNEPHRRGAIATQQMRRKTIPNYLRDALGGNGDDEPVPEGFVFETLDLSDPKKPSALPSWALPAAIAAAAIIAMKVWK